MLAALKKAIAWCDELRQSDWAKIDLRIALICPLAVLICLLGGFFLDAPLSAIIAAGGAFTVGFGARQTLSEWRILPMLACLLGTAAAAFVGSMVGASLLWSAIAAAAAAVLIGLAAARNSSLGWVTIQSAIALIIAASFPGADTALERASWLLIGGSIQIFIFVVALLIGWEKNWQPASQPTPAGAPLLIVKYVLIAVSGVVLERLLPLTNGFWIPMTALIVARPTVSPSWAVIMQRIGGTLVGAIGASIISFFSSGHTDLVLIAAITFCAAFSYACLQVNYGIFSASVTAFASLLLSIHGPPEIEIVKLRALATVVGCLLALAVSVPLALAARRWNKTESPGISAAAATDTTAPAPPEPPAAHR